MGCRKKKRKKKLKKLEVSALCCLLACNLHVHVDIGGVGVKVKLGRLPEGCTAKDVRQAVDAKRKQLGIAHPFHFTFKVAIATALTLFGIQLSVSLSAQGGEQE